MDEDTHQSTGEPRRNKGFDETHREMIETAVRMISESGAEALSIAALAREMGINRTTVYYHFDSREALLQAVSAWAVEQLGHAMDPEVSRLKRVGFNSRFTLENPELAKLWIDDFISGDDIRNSFSQWDEVITNMGKDFTAKGLDVDADVYCVMLLSASIVGARVYRNSIRPDLSVDDVADKFRKELERAMKRDGILRE